MFGLFSLQHFSSNLNLIESFSSFQFLESPRRRAASSVSNHSNMSNVSRSEREQFSMQLELLAETNRRLGESNDDLRNALSVRMIQYSLLTQPNTTLSQR